MNVRIGVLLVPLIVPLLLLAVLLAWWSPKFRTPLEVDPSLHGALVASHRKAVGWRWAGIGLGAVVAALTALTATVDLYNIGAMLAPTIFGLCVIGGVFVGEFTTIPRPQGVRTATVETRTADNYLPRRLSRIVAASALALGTVLVTTTWMGSADDEGRAGRFLSRLCSPDIVARNGPWPGSFYSVPLGIAVVVGLVVAAVALRTVVLRPRSGSDYDLVVADDFLRRRSAEAIVAATGVMVAASLSGVALVAGVRLISVACPTASWTILGVVLLVVGALMLLLTSWCLALLLAARRFTPVPSGAIPIAGQGTPR